MTTVDKAMELLHQFSLERLEIGLNDLAKLTGEDKAVIRRLLISLTNSGFIEQNPENRKYFLGSGFLALARLREATVPMVKATQIVSEWLCKKTSETVHVSIPGPSGMSTVAYNLPQRGNVINLRPAERYPFHASASGLAFLSFCTLETQDRLLDLPREQMTRHTVTDHDELQSVLTATKARGYALSRNGVEVGVASVAMPFFVDAADPAGTIAIAVPDMNLTADHRATLVKNMQVAVRKLEFALTGTSSVQAPEHTDQAG